MRVQVTDNAIKLWASKSDTYEWSFWWPCSQLKCNRFFAEFDANGLCDFTLNGKEADVDATELSACAADLLKESGKIPEDHPARFVAMDQFL